MNINKKKYIIISPCRNEAQYMRETLDSVLAQSVLPSLWVIVDDGSTDGSSAILKEYADSHSFIKILTRNNRGHRSVGPGVIDAFYAGYESVDLTDYVYCCKLDMDLVLPPRYFEILMTRMEENPRIGTCSGKAYYIHPVTGEKISENCSDEHSLGMTKFYRINCFQQIGGFVREVMWDGIDDHQCRMLGWIACSWDDLELRFTHLRPMGSSQENILVGRMRHGYGQYFMGTGLLYITISAIYRLTWRPFILGGLAVWWGYVQSMVKRDKRLPDPELVKFIRKYQWDCLVKGKKKATAQLDEQQAVVWNPDREIIPTEH